MGQMMAEMKEQMAEPDTMKAQMMAEMKEQMAAQMKEQMAEQLRHEMKAEFAQQLRASKSTPRNADQMGFDMMDGGVFVGGDMTPRVPGNGMSPSPLLLSCTPRQGSSSGLDKLCLQRTPKTEPFRNPTNLPQGFES